MIEFDNDYKELAIDCDVDHCTISDVYPSEDFHDGLDQAKSDGWQVLANTCMGADGEMTEFRHICPKHSTIKFNLKPL